MFGLNFKLLGLLERVGLKRLGVLERVGVLGRRFKRLELLGWVGRCWGLGLSGLGYRNGLVMKLCIPYLCRFLPCAVICGLP